MNYILGTLLAFAIPGSIVAAIHLIPHKAECYTFNPADNSHIRLNSCTGEAHVVVRGPNGFEWQRIND